MKELTEQLVESQTQLERVTRDKISLMSELHCVKGQIDSSDMDYGKVRTPPCMAYGVVH